MNESAPQPEQKQPPAPLPTRAELNAAPREVLSRGGPRNSDVLLLQHRGQPMVVKDFAPRGPFVRACIGPFLITRELRAVRRLAGHPSMPRLLGRIDSLALAFEYRPGRWLSPEVTVSADFLARLDAAIALMHARGVVHLDLRHRGNLLLGENETPVLLDFASALCFRPGAWGARLLLPWLALIDRAALAKWRGQVQVRT